MWRNIMKEDVQGEEGKQPGHEPAEERRMRQNDRQWRNPMPAELPDRASFCSFPSVPVHLSIRALLRQFRGKPSWATCSHFTPSCHIRPNQHANSDDQ